MGILPSSMGVAVLGQALAQQIADEITDVIGHNVLITDAAGVVMGSGDESRVGQFHEASVEVVRRRRTIVHTEQDARGLVGTLPGVTVPLTIDDDVVGTVGLSGPPEEVEQFGLVVKRQTEILLQEAAKIGSRMTRERSVTELLREICEWHHARVPETQLIRRGAALGYDLAVPRRILLVQWDNADAGRDDADPARLLAHVESVFDSPADLVAPLSRTVVAVATPDDGGRPGAAVNARCAECLDGARKHRLDLCIAIGCRGAGIAELNVSARDAFDALQLGPAANPGERIHPIDRVRLQQALSVVPIDSRARLTDGLLGPLLRDREWAALRRTLIAWGDCAFNTTRAAARMHVHRNTVIYRLDKITRILGRSLDEPGLAVALYVTCVMDELGRHSAGR